MACSLGLLLVVLSSAAAQSTMDKVVYKLPGYMRVCQRSDPSLDKCLKDTLQYLIPRFSSGVPEFQMPSLDPMHLSDLRMNYEDNSISASILVKNLTFEGISSLVILDVRTLFEEDNSLSIDVDVFFPMVFTEGVGKLAGRFWDFHISRQAKYNITMGGINTTWWIRGVIEDRDGLKFLKVEQFDMKPTVEAMSINIDRLFPDSETLNVFAVGLINRAWPQIYEAFLPAARFNWDKIMIQLANSVFQKVPLDVLMPL